MRPTGWTLSYEEISVRPELSGPPRFRGPPSPERDGRTDGNSRVLYWLLHLFKCCDHVRIINKIYMIFVLFFYGLVWIIASCSQTELSEATFSIDLELYSLF